MLTETEWLAREFKKWSDKVYSLHLRLNCNGSNHKLKRICRMVEFAEKCEAALYGMGDK